MGEEKRFVVFLVLTMLVVVLTKPLFDLVFGPPPRPAAQAPKEPGEGQDAAAKDDADEPQAKEPGKAKTDEAPAAAPVVIKGPEAPQVLEQEPEKESRTLGSTDRASGFKMKVQFTNHGAAVELIELAEYENEDRTGPLQLVSTIDEEEGSFLLGLTGVSAALEKRNWIILDEPAGGEQPDDEVAIRFQTTLAKEKLVITKTYSLKKGSYTLGLKIEIANRGDESRPVTYRLGGPRGLVLEGAWYATKKREAAIAAGSGASLKRDPISTASLVKEMETIRTLADASGGAIRREQWTLPTSAFDRFDDNRDERLSGDEVPAAAYHLAGSKNRYSEQPVRFAGVDSQFFCALVIAPRNVDERWDAVTTPILVSRDRRYPDRSDVSVEIESKAFDVAPGESESLVHLYSVYAGPRKKQILEDSLQDTAVVASIMNFQNALFIFPSSLVSLTAGTMVFLLQTFHGWVGNWGVAILMLTVLVRMLMFPLSRKQALAAVKMQALKPELDALKEKYKGDKEKLSRSQMELWRKHGVNPLGGCLPLLIQMPIFIGLWQGLQSTVDLRQAKFFGWINNLAAPDKLFPFPWPEDVWPLSFLGPYFNLLPCILIALMLVQQKLFMPPKADPPDPQMEMQQKMMTYMMVVFGAFFWKLPSGLCLYYICSTSWGIVERKLLPKLQHAQAPGAAGPEKPTESSERKGRGSDRDGKGGGRDGKDKRPQARQVPTLADRFTDFLKRAGK